VLQELRGCTALTVLETSHCVDVTDVGLWELRDLTALIMLSLRGCFNVTDVGLQHLTSLTALLELELLGTSTTKTGRDALKAAIPGLTIYWR
jgi:F-box/leucine-rich repeat protein 14